MCRTYMAKYLFSSPSSDHWKATALNRRGSIDSLYLSPLPGSAVMRMPTAYQTQEQSCHLFVRRSPANRWYTRVRWLFYFEIY